MNSILLGSPMQVTKLYTDFNGIMLIMCVFAGRYVPTIAKKIHDENANGPEITINLRGLGVGNGSFDPENSIVAAEYFYQV